MFRALRQKLALAYALLAGAVLLAVTVCCLHNAQSELTRASEEAFRSGVNAILYKLQSDRTLSQSWLAQTETSEKQIIRIEDGGTPLLFKGAWQPLTDRETLIERALAHPGAEVFALPLGSLNPNGLYFEVWGDRADRYLACVALVPTPSGGTLRATVLSDMTGLDARLRRQRLLAWGLCAGGLLLLAAIGWVYSGRAVKPAQESHARQVEFTAMASHELKAPLAVVAASVDALAAKPPQAEQDVLLANLSAESLRMARLVDDLLLLARSDAGQWRLRAERVDADTLVIECYERFAPLAKQRGLSLQWALPDEALPPISGDAERLHQALGILLDNALSYTPPGGRVRLSAQARGRCLCLSVEDDGPGIPDAQKARVFDRFYRADGVRRDRAHAGLGLPIAREIARLHGGRIELTDAKPRGARFTIILPR